MKKLIPIFLVLSFFRGVSQELIVNAGWSASSQSDLQHYQYLDIGRTGIPLKVVQSYPSFLQYSLIARFKVGHHFQLGGTWYTTSSAARSTYEDYSGMWQKDYALRCMGIGVTGSYTLSKPQPSFAVNLYTILGLNITSLKAKEYAQLTSDGVPFRNQTDKYHTAAPFSEMGVECQYFFSGKFFMRASAGIQITASSKLTSNDVATDYAAVNWTGVKALAGIGYRLGKAIVH